MKKRIQIFGIAAMMIFAVSASAQNKSNESDINPKDSRECNIYSYANPIAKSRGKAGLVAKIPSKAENQNILPKVVAKSRGKRPACMISFYNYNSQKVHVFVDSNYIGSVQANSFGVVESVKSYSSIYCVSEDKSHQWKQNGECKCTFVYHLRMKEGEGEIKY